MNQPPIDENSERSTPSGKTPFERSRFGGTVRTPKTEDEVPVSKK
ncbi:hypothetical protein [Chryseobacterium salipaludis]|nr:MULTISPECIES: hypothetical protein [Chryseobacterium]MCX3296604.1 hypothetical protein [Planobacterium sp. JC490]